jgi:hypothetical protein
MLTHEAKCLVVLAGGVLERFIEKRARRIADSRHSEQTTSIDVENAIDGLTAEELADLPHLIERALDTYKRQSSRAA